MSSYDAVVVGSGPNGLSAAIVLARAGLSVLVREAKSTIGGGARSAELTLPGFVHDVGSAVHPMAVASPFFRSLPLEQHGLEWIHPPVPLAHPFDDAPPALLERGVDETARDLGPDGAGYKRLFAPLVRSWPRLIPELLSPVFHFPRSPFAMAGFGARALWPASALARTAFRGERARGLFAGLSAHSILPLQAPASSAIGLVLATAGHSVGWPIPRGGSQTITNALAGHFRSLGGVIETDARVDTLDALPSARAILLDLTPRQVVSVAAKQLASNYVRALRSYSYGPGIFKMDWALSGPIPWKDRECAQTATVHLGGTLQEIEESEKAPWEARHSERPFVLLAQQSLFDSTRTPAGQHSAWAYCHVPAGSTKDTTEQIESQVERFAPGFRDLILAKRASNAADLEQSNANLVGGDISGGANTLRQVVARPVLAANSYRTSDPRVYICSSSTPPGGGVHGMCGYHAARSVLKHTFGR